MGFNLPEIKGDMVFESFPAGPLQCNCSVIGDPLTKRGIIVDPGGDPEKIMSIVRENELQITAIVHTHAHLDHVLASATIKEQTGAPLYLHQGDMFLWNDLESQCEKYGVPYIPTPEPDAWLNDESLLDCTECGTVSFGGICCRLRTVSIRRDLQKCIRQENH